MKSRYEETLELFLAEAREGLAEFERTLLTIENTPEEERKPLIAKALRIVHSIKGSAAYFGFANIDSLSHALENAFGKARSGEMKLTKERIDCLLQGGDLLADLVEVAETSDENDISETLDTIDFVVQECQKEKQREKAIKSSPQLPKAAQELTNKLVRLARSNGERVFALKLTKSAKASEKVKGDLEAIGTFVDEPAKGYLRFRSILEHDLVAQALEVPLKRLFELPLISKAPQKEKALKKEAPVSAKEPASSLNKEALPPDEITQEKKSIHQRSSIRVSVDLLDNLLNLTGELVLARNHLNSIAAPLASDFPELAGAVQRIGTVTSSIHDRIMRTRLQPIDSVVRRLPRIVRDLCSRLGKEVELSLEGTSVELDRTVLERVSEPLIHLVRNAMDHGIEKPSERESAGKSKRGQIVVEASHAGDFVNLEVRDDGRGVDHRMVINRARERQLITAVEAARITPREALPLLMTPGFSTRDEVTSVSGRGVGLDVVRAQLERIGGSVTIRTDYGEGTAVTMLLPVKVSIVPAVIVSSAAFLFVILQKQIVKLERVPYNARLERVVSVDGRSVLRTPRGLVPLVRLSDLLGLDRYYFDERSGMRQLDRRQAVADRRALRLNEDGTPEEQFEGTNRREVKDRRADEDAMYIVILSVGDHGFGLVVDGVVDSEEVVVKSLPAHFTACSYYFGATILGDGTLAPILDPEGLVRKAQLTFATVDTANRSLQQEEESLLSVEGESYLLFSNGREHYGVNVSDVAKLDRFLSSEVQLRAGTELLERNGQSVRLVNIEKLLGTEGPELMPERAYAIMPRDCSFPFAIVAHNIVDTIDVDDLENSLQQSSISHELVKGTLIVDGRVVVVPDLKALVEKMANEGVSK